MEIANLVIFLNIFVNDVEAYLFLKARLPK